MWGGVLESRCSRRFVSDLDVNAEIIRRIVPQARGARLYSVKSNAFRTERRRSSALSVTEPAAGAVKRVGLGEAEPSRPKPVPQVEPRPVRRFQDQEPSRHEAQAVR